MGRISFDIFGKMHLDECTIQTRLIRPGRTIELIESQMEIQGQVCVVARAWRMLVQDSSAVAGLEDQSVPGPHAEGILWVGQEDWPGGYIQSLQAVQGSDHRPGKGVVWLNTDKVLVAGQRDSDFSHLICLVDMANGVVHRHVELSISWHYCHLMLYFTKCHIMLYRKYVVGILGFFDAKEALPNRQRLFLCARSMGALLRVQVPPSVDHSE